MAKRTTPLLKYQRQRCQARRLRQPWDPDFTFEQWWGLWQPHWGQQGRGLMDLCMVRLDHDQAWHHHNVVICERWEYLTVKGAYFRLGQRC